MNINSHATNILCFGDSNTWGQKPDKSGRYASDVRWTGHLQRIMGDDFYIIEEGLSSRTTDLDYASKPGRNGRTYLEPCLDSHNPLDAVILMLGTNDLKIEFDRTPDNIATALKGLVVLIQERAMNKTGAAPKIILMSPILVDDTAPTFERYYTGYYNHDAAVKSTQLAEAVARAAKETGSHFLDASKVARPGEDGIHFSRESHGALAEKLATELNSILA